LSCTFNFGPMNALLPATYFCPGRVNLIGEHIDYNGGLVMPAAISLGITAEIAGIEEQKIILSSDHSTERVELPIIGITAKPGHWCDHVIGVLLDLQRCGLSLTGCEISLSSTLPQGSGLSSSAAIEVLIHYMLTHWLTGMEPDRREMALACQRVENTHIGVNCGIMDQYAVALGRKGHALLLDCASVQHEEIPLNLAGHTLLIIDSKAPRQLASSAYNERRRECDAALAVLRQNRDRAFLTEAKENELSDLHDRLLRKRARHVVSEQQRVVAAAAALQGGDMHEFGQLLNSSHASLRNDYEVSSPQLDHIVSMAQGTDGCLGARLTGAGFGGCCIALMRDDAVAPFVEKLKSSYLDAFGLHAEVHTVEVVDGVSHGSVRS
jgi:galactokinase